TNLTIMKLLQLGATHGYEKKVIKKKQTQITKNSTATKRTTPNARRPNSPAAWKKASAAVLSSANATPVAATPRTAKKSSTRITPVMMMPMTEVKVMSLTCSGPDKPESIRRCAPAKVM